MLILIGLVGAILVLGGLGNLIRPSKGMTRKQAAIAILVGIVILAGVGAPKDRNNTGSTGVAAISGSAAPAGSAATLTAPTAPRIEYLAPSPGSPVNIVNVIFDRDADPAAAERAVRAAIEDGLRTGRIGDGEVLGNAWRQTAGHDEELLQFPDGSDALVFDRETRSIISMAEQARRRMAAAPAAATLDVRLDIALERQADGALVVRGQTNLPGGMDLMVTLQDTRETVLGQDRVSVHNGQFVSSGFTAGRRPHRPGAYVIEITSPWASLEPPSVQAVIGPLGQALTGPFVKVDMGGATVNAAFQRQVQ